MNARTLKNADIEEFYRRKALAVYESLWEIREHLTDDFQIAKKELECQGIDVPDKVQPVSGIVQFRRSVANEHAGNWILFELSTGYSLGSLDSESDVLVEQCREVAKANQFFLAHALGKKADQEGKIT